MVIELLLNPRKAERTPWELFFIGLIYSSAGIFMGMLIFNQHVGLVMVFLTTLACTYLVHGMFRLEEKKDAQNSRGSSFLLKAHGKALSVFMFLFLGFVVAFSFWYIVLPSATVQSVFSLQEQTIQAINTPADVSGAMTSSAFLSKIFINNAKVLLFTLLFAFFYGAGAVFILAWNAAVVGTAVGMFVRASLATLTAEFGFVSASQYFAVYSAGLLRYLTHGAFEILAYFMVALAGGMISIAVARHEFNTPEFRRTVRDSADLVVLSIAILFLAGLIEVFVTPRFF